MSERYNPYESKYISEKQGKDQEVPRTPEIKQQVVPKEGEKRWVYENKGIQNVPLDKISFEDNPIKNPADFHKVSHDEMVRGFQRLENEVRPAVEKGATAEYFSSYDKEHSLPPAQGTEQIYSSFYGHEAIQLVKDGDRYFVGNGGYHRLFVARELRLETVPARVLEKKPG